MAASALLLTVIRRSAWEGNSPKLGDVLVRRGRYAWVGFRVRFRTGQERSYERAMIKASCHCGSVHLEIDALPSEVTECNCSICRRYGVLWAYYPLDQVRVLPSDPPTNVYMWNGRTTEFHRCGNCGCVSHWSPVNRD